MNPPVAGGNDEPPRNFRIECATGIVDMGCRFANQFQITNSGISTWARNSMCPSYLAKLATRVYCESLAKMGFAFFKPAAIPYQPEAVIALLIGQLMLIS